MKRFIGAVSFRHGGKVKKYGQRVVMEKLAHRWLIRVRFNCRDPETGRAYRIMRDISVTTPAKLSAVWPVVAMTVDELRAEAKNQHYSGGWFALALKSDKKKR